MRQPDQQASYYVAVYMTAPPHVLRMHEGRIVYVFLHSLYTMHNDTYLNILGCRVYDVRVWPRQARCDKFIPAIRAFVHLCIHNISPFS